MLTSSARQQNLVWESEMLRTIYLATVVDSPTGDFKTPKVLALTETLGVVVNEGRR